MIQLQVPSSTLTHDVAVLSLPVFWFREFSFLPPSKFTMVVVDIQHAVQHIAGPGDGNRHHQRRPIRT
jgi:hypothetical protein